MSERNEQMSLFRFPYDMADEEEDGGLIRPVIACARRLLSLPHVTPVQIVGLARVIYALERLPQPTNGVDVEYAFGFRFGQKDDFDETKYLVQITADNISFSTLFRTWNLKTGDDHETNVAFEMQAGRNLDDMNDDAWSKALEWADGLARVFENNAPNDLLLDVYDNSASDCLEGEGP